MFAICGHVHVLFLLDFRDGLVVLVDVIMCIFFMFLFLNLIFWKLCFVQSKCQLGISFNLYYFSLLWTSCFDVELFFVCNLVLTYWDKRKEKKQKLGFWCGTYILLGRNLSMLYMWYFNFMVGIGISSLSPWLKVKSQNLWESPRSCFFYLW